MIMPLLENGTITPHAETGSGEDHSRERSPIHPDGYIHLTKDTLQYQQQLQLQNVHRARRRGKTKYPAGHRSITKLVLLNPKASKFYIESNSL